MPTFTSAHNDRMHALLERNTEGTLSESEHAELESLVRMAHLVTITKEDTVPLPILPVDLPELVLPLSGSRRAAIAAWIVMTIDEMMEEDRELIASMLWRFVNLDEVDEETIARLKDLGILSR